MRHSVRFGLVFLAAFSLSCSSYGLLLSASPLSGEKHDGFDFTEQTLAWSQVINANFNKSLFPLSQWQQISVKNTNWTSSQLMGVRASKVNLKLIQFVDSDLSGFKCNSCSLQDVLFEKTRLDGAHFIASNLRNVRFIRSDLSRADFVSSTCENCFADGATAKTVSSEQLKKWNILVKDTP